MRTFRLPFAVLAAALLSLAAVGTAQDELASLRFMQGCWRGAFGVNAEIEETWTSPEGGVMLATTRYRRAGRVVSWEFSRIQADSAGALLVPYPGGRESVAFRRVRGADGEERFENPAHDFPQRIIYRSAGADSLMARIEGGERAMEWRMGRVACPGA